VTQQDPPILGGRYELGEVLGYGGMAEVHRGHDVRLGREVAVKVLRADLARDPSFLSRFRREAQSAAALSHPAIVSVFDTGEDVLAGQRVPFIVMEYVEGRTLREVVQSEGRLLPRRAVEIVAEVCAALEYSHTAGIVHRDIKPGNVMITSTGEVKVMDFGIARAVTVSSSAMTQTAAVMGTAQYLSPEQARGEHVDARSDVYSTGCLLYELLTGQPPFTGDSPVAVAYQHVREDPVPPSALDPDITGDLDAVVLKAMAKNPANRYQSAADFGADLDRVAAGRRVAATPVLAGGVVGTGAVRTVVAPPPPVRTAVPLTPSPERRAGRGAAYALLALGVVAVFVVAALVARNAFDKGGSREVRTPQLVGRTLTQAQQALTAAGLTLGTVDRVPQTDPAAATPKDQVLSQSVGAPFTVQRGYTINISVSDGLEQVPVPDVVGQSVDDAKKNLALAHLQGNPNVQDNPNPAVPKGQVTDVGPKPGATVAVGSTITLTVASGAGTIPPIRGLSLDDAVATLRQAGYVVSGVKQTAVGPDAGVQPGQILTSNPGQGRTGEPYGTAVALILAVSPPPPRPTPSPIPPPAPTTPAPTTAAATSSAPATAAPTTAAPGTSAPAPPPTTAAPTTAPAPTP